MTGALTLFIISIIGLVAMFWLKLHELKHGKALYSDSVRQSADKALKDTVDRAATVVSRAGQIPVKDVAAKAVGHIGTGMSKAYKKAANSDNRVTNFVRGRKILTHREKKSDFLNDIETYKRENGGGEIEG